MLDRKTLANWVGIASVLLSVIPLAYIARPNVFPYHALTESVVLIGGVGGSLFAAVIAGLIVLDGGCWRCSEPLWMRFAYLGSVPKVANRPVLSVIA